MGMVFAWGAVAALENMLPGMAARSVVTEAADAASRAVLPGSWQSQDAVGNAATLKQREALLADSYEAQLHRVQAEIGREPFYFVTGAAA